MSFKIRDSSGIKTVKDERGTLGFFELPEECNGINYDIIVLSGCDDDLFELNLGNYQYICVALLSGSLLLQDSENKNRTFVLERADTISVIEGDRLVNIMDYGENTAALLFCYRKDNSKHKLYSVDDCVDINFAENKISHNRKGIRHITNTPFSIKRFYYMKDVLQGFDRGHHAHKELFQLFFAMNGRFELTLEDGENMQSKTVQDDGVAILVGPGLWRELRKFSQNAICLVLASEKYDEADYIRNYDEFIAWRKAKQGTRFYGKKE